MSWKPKPVRMSHEHRERCRAFFGDGFDRHFPPKPYIRTWPDEAQAAAMSDDEVIAAFDEGEDGQPAPTGSADLDERWERRRSARQRLLEAEMTRRGIEWCDECGHVRGHAPLCPDRPEP